MTKKAKEKFEKELKKKIKLMTNRQLFDATLDSADYSCSTQTNQDEFEHETYRAALEKRLKLESWLDNSYLYEGHILDTCYDNENLGLPCVFDEDEEYKQKKRTDESCFCCTFCGCTPEEKRTPQ
jgi:hypothetical protein